MAKVANEFASDCILTNLRNRSTASLKSVLALISADVRYGDRCTVQVRGEDDLQAQAALIKFVEQVLPACDVVLPAPVIVSGNGAIPRVLKSAAVPLCFGSPASAGIGQGQVIFLNGLSFRRRDNRTHTADPQIELEKITRATNAVCARLREKLNHSQNPTETGILQAELALASDILFAEKLEENAARGLSAEDAVAETGEFFIHLLRRSESEYIRDRALDIEEICFQFLEAIGGSDLTLPPLELSAPSVVVIDSLAPQQLLALDRQHLQALVLEHSGPTPHAVILARSLGIPTLIGVKNARQMLTPRQEVIVDAIRGLIATQVSPPVSRFYEKERRTLERRRQLLLSSASLPATTVDGKTIEVAANAASYDELRLAFENGADGIGLFRTEGIFLGRERAPSEEDQFQVYAYAARMARGRPVIIRTFDLGADKPVPYINVPVEKNPFLGYRGARLYSEHRGLLRDQLRAILRASVSGRVQVMAPMISSLEDVMLFKAAIGEAKQELARTGTAFNPEIPIGVMIEVPSAGFILDQLCKEVDFFSIGTNDLNQYFLAADRDNPGTAHISDVLHPGFLRFLKKIVEEVHAAGKWVGMCGQMAAEISHLPLLLGMRLDEISVPVTRIPEVKKAICHLSVARSEVLLARAINLSRRSEIHCLFAQGQTPQSSHPLLVEELIQLESESATKEEAIQEIVDAFYVAGRTENRLGLEEALWSRESLYSTGLGYGFATPHCKTGAVTADSIAVLKLKQGVDWDSVDHQPVNMIILIAMREPQQAGKHMQVFSKLARKLMDEEFRNELLTLRQPGEMILFLTRELEFSCN